MLCIPKRAYRSTHCRAMLECDAAPRKVSTAQASRTGRSRSGMQYDLKVLRTIPHICTVGVVSIYSASFQALFISFERGASDSPTTQAKNYCCHFAVLRQLSRRRKLCQLDSSCPALLSYISSLDSSSLSPPYSSASLSDSSSSYGGGGGGSGRMCATSRPSR